MGLSWAVRSEPVADVDDAVLRVVHAAVGLDLRIVPPARAGPVVVLLDFLQGLHLLHGGLGHLGVGALVGRALAVGDGLALDPPEVLDRAVGVFLEGLADVARPVVVAEIDPEEFEQLLVAVATEVLHRLLLDLGDHPVVDRDPVGFLVLDGRHGALAAAHALVLGPQFADPCPPLLKHRIVFHRILPYVSFRLVPTSPASP